MSAISSTPGYSYVLRMRVHTITSADALNTMIDWAQSRQSRYVCSAPSHMVMETYDCEQFRTVVNSADLVIPDGVPVVLALRIRSPWSASGTWYGLNGGGFTGR